MQINLSDWVSLVQDVAAGLQVLPPGLSNCLDPKILNLLHRLEVVTQVKFCCLCYYQGQNVDVQECLYWLPYLMEPDYGADSGIWDDRLLQRSDYSEYLLGRYVQTRATSTRDFHLGPISVEGPISQNPVTTPPYRPPAGRAKWLKATLSMRGLVPWAPQMVPAIRQPPLLSWS